MDVASESSGPPGAASSPVCTGNHGMNPMPAEAQTSSSGSLARLPTLYRFWTVARGVIDGRSRAITVEKLGFGSVTPISLYRRRVADEQPPQSIRTVRRLVDLPLLEAVNHPVTVNADARLAAIGAHRHWPALSLR